MTSSVIAGTPPIAGRKCLRLGSTRSRLDSAADVDSRTLIKDAA